MSCCSPIEWDETDKIDSECPDCGADTTEGEAWDQCSYSNVECKTCHYAPCDQSC